MACLPSAACIGYNNNTFKGAYVDAPADQNMARANGFCMSSSCPCSYARYDVMTKKSKHTSDLPGRKGRDCKPFSGTDAEVRFRAPTGKSVGDPLTLGSCRRRKGAVTKMRSADDSIS